MISEQQRQLCAEAAWHCGVMEQANAVIRSPGGLTSMPAILTSLKDSVSNHSISANHLSEVIQARIISEKLNSFLPNVGFHRNFAIKSAL